MRRRAFIALAGASVAWPFAAMAQEPGRTYRLGILSFLAREATVNTALFDELRREAFIEGKNLTIDYRATALHQDRVLEYAAELVNARVDVIAAAGIVAIRAAQEATRTIPIVAITDDLLGSGLVNSLSRPDRNITGVSILAGEADGKRQDILIEAVPGLRLMAVLVDVNYTKLVKLDALQEAARVRNVEFSICRVTKGEEIPTALDSSQASGAKALNILASPLFYAHRHLIMERAATARLPTIYEVPETAEEGGFAGFGPRFSQLLLEIWPHQIVKLFRGSKVNSGPTADQV
jgi:putative tryptophan/tyrosine transport system substrate-binding protein